MNVRLSTDYMKQGNDSKTRQFFFVDFIDEGYRLTALIPPTTPLLLRPGEKHTVSLNLFLLFGGSHDTI